MAKYLVVVFLLILQRNASLAEPAGIENESYAKDAAIMGSCLRTKNGRFAEADLQKLTTFDRWGEREELPCFTRCICAAKGWFDEAAGRWNRARVASDLDDQMYEYCRRELEAPYSDSCDFVHTGFRCLKQAEVALRKAALTIWECALELQPDLLVAKVDLADVEGVPCLFKCFAERLGLYAASPAGLAWNFTNWRTYLGPFEGEEARYGGCRVDAAERGDSEEDKCVWMYAEYVCMGRRLRSENPAAVLAGGEACEQTTEEAATADDPTPQAALEDEATTEGDASATATEAAKEDAPPEATSDAEPAE